MATYIVFFPHNLCLVCLLLPGGAGYVVHGSGIPPAW